MAGGTRSSARSRPTREERRVLSAVEGARRILPDYGRGRPATSDEVARLAEAFRVRVHRSCLEMDAPAVLVPPFGGWHRLVLAPHLGPSLSRYVTLHEIGHVLAGDADEITFLRAHADVPEGEDVADLFALLGFLRASEVGEDPEELEARIRRRVALDDRGWRDLRIPRLARKLSGLRERLGGWGA